MEKTHPKETPDFFPNGRVLLDFCRHRKSLLWDDCSTGGGVGTVCVMKGVSVNGGIHTVPPSELKLAREMPSKKKIQDHKEGLAFCLQVQSLTEGRRRTVVVVKRWG